MPIHTDYHLSDLKPPHQAHRRFHSCPRSHRWPIRFNSTRFYNVEVRYPTGFPDRFTHVYTKTSLGEARSFISLHRAYSDPTCPPVYRIRYVSPRRHKIALRRFFGDVAR